MTGNAPRYALVLEQVTQEIRSSGGSPQPPAGDAELRALRRRAASLLSADVPPDYLEFLMINDGLEYDGTVFYASHRSPIVGYTDRLLEGFVDGNLSAREVPVMERYLVFGESDDTLHVVEQGTGRYRTIESIGLGPYREYESLDGLIEQVLSERL